MKKFSREMGLDLPPTLLSGDDAEVESIIRSLAPRAALVMLAMRIPEELARVAKQLDEDSWSADGLVAKLYARDVEVIRWALARAKELGNGRKADVHDGVPGVRATPHQSEAIPPTEAPRDMPENVQEDPAR